MKKETGKRIILFLLLSFVPMWGLSYIYYVTRKDTILLIMMLLPAVASVMTRIITKEGLSGMMIHPNLKKNLKWYFISYFAPPFIAYFGAMMYFFVFKLSDFTPLQSAFAVEESISSTSELLKALFTLIPLAIIINPIMGIVQCFGEELGWRGYLLPKLTEKNSPLFASVLTGVIWGLWHAPIIAIWLAILRHISPYSAQPFTSTESITRAIRRSMSKRS